MKIFIDLETIPTQKQSHADFLNAKLKPPANYKSQEAKDKWMLANKDSVVEKTSFDGGFGEICTIGYAFDDGEIKTIQRKGEDNDEAVINEFIDDIKMRFIESAKRIDNIYWIAHNKDFDLRFLFHRLIVNRCESTFKVPVDDRYNKHSFCTMAAWRGLYGKQGGSLDSVCQSLGIIGKKGMTGADVWPSYQAKEYDKIAEYCADDVRALREIFNRIEPYCQ